MRKFEQSTALVKMMRPGPTFQRQIGPNHKPSRGVQFMAEKNLPAVEVLRQRLHYEPNTGRLIWKATGRNIPTGAVAGRVSVRGYREVRIMSRLVAAHRIIWALHYGEWPETEIDHINGARDDNRIGNLRLATRAQNAQNLGPSSRNTSGTTGVSWDKRTRSWMAYIKVGRKFRNLGRFPTIEQAAEVRRRAKAELHPFDARSDVSA